MTRTPRTQISPKVTGSTTGSAAGVVIAWLIAQVPFVDYAPAAVQAAIVVLVIAAWTFAGGYVTRDPRRGGE